MASGDGVGGGGALGLLIIAFFLARMLRKVLILRILLAMYDVGVRSLTRNTKQILGSHMAMCNIIFFLSHTTAEGEPAERFSRPTSQCQL